MQTTLDTRADIQWIYDVHLRTLDFMASGPAIPLESQVTLAILHGNEDCPDKIELYRRNHVDCKPTILLLQDEQYVVVQTGTS